jgi:hypothetical protein
MSTSGARGPALPPKAAAPLAPKVVTPAAPPVEGKPVTPPMRPRLESNAAMSPGGAKVLVAAHVSQPSLDDDDAWGEVATKIEAVAPKAAQATPDIQALIKAAVDEALAPVGDAFLRLERRVLEVERRSAITVGGSPAPYVASASPLAPAASTQTVAPPIGAPAPRPVVYAPRPSDLVVDASPLAAYDNPFDGKRRRRRVAAIFIFLILVGLGTPLGILIASYMR